MNEMNELLSVIENPTRRRILEALSREPHYPLQLAKELGISQPAVVKHLDIMERNGLITSRQADSRMGPKRTVYETASEFTLTVDLRNGMFITRLVLPEDKELRINGISGLRETRENISEIDKKIAELERMRSAMLRERESLITSMLRSAEELGYGHRSLLYEVLNDPGKDIDDISLGLSMNMKIAEKMMDDIESIFQTKKEKKVVRYGGE